MTRRIYLWWMRFRRKHVLASDCWCNPEVKDYR